MQGSKGNADIKDKLLDTVEKRVVQSVSPTFCDPHGLQHAKLPCLSLSPRVCSNSCPLCWWCHPTTSSSVTHFSSCPQCFPASGSFPMIQLFALGSQSIGASASVSVLPKIIQGWFPLGLIGLISCSPRDSWEFLQHHNSKASILWGSAFFMVQLSHPHMTTGKTIALTIWTFLAKWCLCILIRCLGLSELFFQGASLFEFHGCSHHLQWFWSLRK